MVCIDFSTGFISSVNVGGKELVVGKTPLFTIRMRTNEGNAVLADAFQAKKCECKGNLAVYSGFPFDIEVEVEVGKADETRWQIRIRNHTDMVIEWVDFPSVRLDPLKKNGGEASVLIPYNEGAIVEDAWLRQKSIFPHVEPEYPSHGSYYMFPYMLSSQFMCYLLENGGLYMGAHDPERGVKSIDFFPDTTEDGAEGVMMRLRLFTGTEFGQDYENEYPIVWRAFEGSWQDGAEVYRQWFEENLPPNAIKILDNPNLPEWYEDSPLVVSYPVRGVHDMDIMNSNALFPYEKGLPLIEEIAKKTGCRIMVLLMHWEGTAPWAPPYVWPPFGGEESLNRFIDQLHEQGHLLGVYCSGFGWTLKSNLVDDYDNTSKYETEALEEAMCAAPDGKVHISRICTGQRSGYDLCVGAEKAKEILEKAYAPLLKSDVDYAQILDQNHGGSQYFCYSKEHGHPPVPGKWMVSTMQKLLSGWNQTAGRMLLGCESAAAEAYMGNLLLSDNRYELNWHIGYPIPLYAYLYHEYLRNFMGNQVCCAFSNQEDTMCARLAYSFAAGDCMTIVMTPDGNLMNNWGCHDFSNLPDMERALTFIANMNRFYREQAKPYLYAGKMCKPFSYECEKIAFPSVDGRMIEMPVVISTAWEHEGKKVQIFINHTTEDAVVEYKGRQITIKALSGYMEEL